MPNRESYLRFLSRMGKNEEEVLPILTDHEKKKLDILGSLLQAVQETDAPEYQEVLTSDEALKIKWQLALSNQGTNTNFLLSRLYNELRDDFKELGIPVFNNIFAGVYPTYSFNAQARPEDNGYLILLDTGCFETIEAAVTILLGPWTHGQKIAMLIQVVRDYCHRRKLPRSEDLRNIPSEKQSGLEIARALKTAEEITPLLTNGCERFVIAHEYGHIIRGHFEGGSLTSFGEHGELKVISKDQEEEFEADLWSLNTLIRQTDKYDARERLITYTGALITLGMDLLIDECQRLEQKREAPPNSHPPALDRMRLLQTFYERLAWNVDFKQSGRIDGSFLRLVSDCSLSLGGKGIPLAKSMSVETLEDESERQLACAFGMPYSSHDRIVPLKNGDDLMKRLVDKMRIDLVSPPRNPLGVALDELDKIKLRLFIGLEVLLLTAGGVSFYFTGSIFFPAIAAALSIVAAVLYFRFL